MQFLRTTAATLVGLVFPYRWMASIVLLLLLDFISYQAFTRSAVGLPFAHQDKVLHFGAFFVLFLLGHLSLNYDFFPRVTRFSFKIHALNWLIWLCYGLLIEGVQSFLNYRGASAADFIADLCGITCASLTVVSLKLYPKPTAAETHPEPISPNQGANHHD
ncbi:VanZ family protein [Acanthopleuribacter pedis]|uniref:VanZ family protein n=1 Tax=Acanthopleuribacter pedis TaxID=442870 RepID=A0A8J7QIS9_9BACT|nr:VanZ family protein [Acanthopleuribacter pedis]MBO1321536.1 VanZ family protein [Acanthopleuribacter pedis]